VDTATFPTSGMGQAWRKVIFRSGPIEKIASNFFDWPAPEMISAAQPPVMPQTMSKNEKKISPLTQNNREMTYICKEFNIQI
jgi:hypothetical protein